MKDRASTKPSSLETDAQKVPNREKLFFKDSRRLMVGEGSDSLLSLPPMVNKNCECRVLDYLWLARSS